jgi:hypothetical protein
MTVGTGVTLTLRNMTLIGYSANTAEMIKITKGGTVILENVTIQDNTVVKGTAPGAVSIDGGTLIMKNGVITNNIGGPASIFLVGAIGIPISLTTQPASGIHVSSGGIFEMTGGTIDVNSRTEDNKIVCAVFIGNGFFNMYGGSISNNRKNGVGLVDGIFNMYGGTIAGNTLTGVALFYAGTGIFAMYGDATVPPSSDKRTNDVLTTYPNSGGIARPVYIGSPLTGSAPVANITGGGIVEGNLSNENKAKLLIGGNPWL